MPLLEATILSLKVVLLTNFGFSKNRKTKVVMEVMQVKCRVCGKGTSDFSDGYCVRCEKIAADVDAELGIAPDPRGSTI